MKKLNTFIESPDMKFGDYILFQEYVQDKHDGVQYHYKISKPKLVIYLGCFVADQTIGFNYVQWINENHIIKINNEYIKNYKTKKRVDDINCHIEWSDYIDILGYWNHKPTWKEILPTYRKQNINEYVKSDEIDWE